jgi:glutathione S-transferase
VMVRRLADLCEDDKSKELFGNEAENGQINAWLDFCKNEMPSGLKVGAVSPKAIQVLENHFKSRNFLLGDKFSVADINMVCILIERQMEPQCDIDQIVTEAGGANESSLSGW